MHERWNEQKMTYRFAKCTRAWLQVSYAGRVRQPGFQRGTSDHLALAWMKAAQGSAADSSAADCQAFEPAAWLLGAAPHPAVEATAPDGATNSRLWQTVRHRPSLPRAHLRSPYSHRSRPGCAPPVPGPRRRPPPV